MNKKNSHPKMKKLFLLLIIIIIITITSSFYIKLQSNSLQGWNSLSSIEFNYSLKYPEKWTIYSPTPDRSYEGDIIFVSESEQNNLHLTAYNKKNDISFQEKADMLKYWSWEDKKTGYEIIGKDKLNSFWMTGTDNGKKKKVWLIEGTEQIYTFLTMLDYNQKKIELIVRSIELVE